MDVQRHSVHTLVFRSLKRTHDMFLLNQGSLPPVDPVLQQMKKAVKAKDCYSPVLERVRQINLAKVQQENDSADPPPPGDETFGANTTSAMVPYNPTKGNTVVSVPIGGGGNISGGAITIPPKKTPSMTKPKWHAPWKLYRVISGHLGWVRCCAVEPVTLAVFVVLLFRKGIPISFPVGRIVRLNAGIIDVLVTAGRDSTGRVWDMRTKANVHTLVGHTNTVASVICQSAEPQIITGSHDCTIRLWDLAAGKSRATLTNHKKSVRSLAFHPSLYMFASASPDNIKQWKCPEGKFIQNLSGHNAIVNCLAVNADGVLVSGADNGTMHLWDWRTGYNFQRLQAPVQPGSMDSEAGVFSITFDMSGTRMITTEADKTIKVYKEDDSASEETHPIDWRPDIIKRRKY